MTVAGERLAALAPVSRVQKVSLKCMVKRHAFRKVVLKQEFKTVNLLRPWQAGLGMFEQLTMALEKVEGWF